MLSSAQVLDVVVPARRRSRLVGEFSGGFDATAVPRRASMVRGSRRACERRIAHCLRQYREFLATSATARQAFDDAVCDLRQASAAQAWSYRVCVDDFDVTFWIGAADAHGAEQHGAEQHGAEQHAAD